MRLRKFTKAEFAFAGTLSLYALSPLALFLKLNPRGQLHGLSRLTAPEWSTAWVLLGLWQNALWLALWKLGQHKMTPHFQKALTWVAAACVLSFLWGAPGPDETDSFRYFWDGVLVSHGVSPYTHPPDIATIQALTQQGTLPASLGNRLQSLPFNFSQLATIYPPLAELGFALLATLARWNPWIFVKVVALTSWLALLWGWNALRKQSSQSESTLNWTLLAIHPLFLRELLFRAHFDGWMMGLVLWAGIALSKNAPSLRQSTLAIACATAVKPTAAAAFLVYPREKFRLPLPRTAALALGAGLAIVLAAVSLEKFQAHGALSASLQSWKVFTQTWEANSGIFRWIREAFSTYEWSYPWAGPASRVMVATLWLVGLLKIRNDFLPLRAYGSALFWAFLSMALLSPVANPWYFTWALALLPWVAHSAPGAAPRAAFWLLLGFAALPLADLWGAREWVSALPQEPGWNFASARELARSAGVEFWWNLEHAWLLVCAVLAYRSRKTQTQRA